MSMRQYFRRRWLHASSICRTISGLLPNSLLLRAIPKNFGRPSQRRQLVAFVSDFKLPSVHVRKSRVWAVKQIFHFLVLNQCASKDITTDLRYLKIERTASKWAMKSSLCLAFPPGKPKDRNMSYVKGRPRSLTV